MVPCMRLKHEYFVIVPKTVGQKASNTPCKTVFHQLRLFQNIIHEALLNALAVITDWVIFRGEARFNLHPSILPKKPTRVLRNCLERLHQKLHLLLQSGTAQTNNHADLSIDMDFQLKRKEVSSFIFCSFNTNSCLQKPTQVKGDWGAKLIDNHERGFQVTVLDFSLKSIKKRRSQTKQIKYLLPIITEKVQPQDNRKQKLY